MQMSYEYTRIKKAINRFPELQVDTDTIRAVIELGLLSNSLRQFEADTLLQDLNNIDSRHPAYSHLFS